MNRRQILKTGAVVATSLSTVGINKMFTSKKAFAKKEPVRFDSLPPKPLGPYSEEEEATFERLDGSDCRQV